MKSTKLFHKNFTIMAIGQVISLLGNSILRFALPLYLYNETGSSTLLGLASALSFVPMLLLSPVGGIIADRVNKRNIMVALDFGAAALMLACILLLGRVSLVPLLIVVMMLLYGIQGAYQPAVQASVPALVSEGTLVQANAVVNTISSLSGLVGPLLGGVLLTFFGLVPILLVSGVCFFVSAVMEIFLHIPHTRKTGGQKVLAIVQGDMRESLQFVLRTQPIVGKAVLLVAAFNLFFSSVLVVGLPVIVTGALPFGAALGNQLYSYTQGAMAAGGLAGGILAGTLAKKLSAHKVHRLLLGCAACLVPPALALLLGAPAMVSYLVLTVCCFIAMAMGSMFTVQMLAFVQGITPGEIVGKVISVVLAVCMCAQPLGQLLYGAMFDLAPPQAVLGLAAAASLVVALCGRRVFSTLRAAAAKVPV